MPRITIPSHFKCPLSGELMKNPVVTADGHAFEKKAIKKWLKKSKKNPTTNESLSSLSLHPCIVLKNMLEEFTNSVCSPEELEALMKEHNVSKLREAHYFEEYINPEFISDVLDTTDPSLLAWLLEDAGVKPNTELILPDGVTSTLLHVAVKSNVVDLVQVLLNHSADPNSLDSDGNTPFLFCETVEIAKLLIGAGADINLCDTEGQNLLSISTCNGNYELVTWLCENAGFNKDHVTKKGKTLMHGAAYGCNTRLLKYFLDGDNINAVSNKKKTPLHFAVAQAEEDTEAVKWLIKKGADVDAKDKDGWTPLRYAIDLSKTEIAELLLDSGANMFEIDSKGVSPYDAAQREDRVIFASHYQYLLNNQQKQDDNEDIDEEGDGEKDSEMEGESDRDEESEVEETFNEPATEKELLHKEVRALNNQLVACKKRKWHHCK